MRSLLAIVVALSVVSSCKKKDTEPKMDPSTTSGSAEMVGSSSAGAPHHAHHLHVGPELEKFQDTLGDRWHEPKGEQRKKDACDQVTALETSAADVAKAPAPGSADATKWTIGGKALGDAVATMKSACTGADVAAFESAYDHVHMSFHGLIALAGGHHEGDGTHEHTM